MTTRRRAYAALAIITLVWSGNWFAMKGALAHADPFVFNIHRTLLAVAVLFVVMVAQGRRFWPESWIAVIVTGFFQVSLNFLATAMALVEGGVGRTSVLVFTMPFWTLLMAWPLLHERPRGLQWVAILLALAGLLVVVSPWDWRGSLAPKLWAVLSGFGWAAATVATKYFQRKRSFDPINYVAWHMLVGLAPFFVVVALRETRPTEWTPDYLFSLLYAGVLSISIGWLLWIAVLERLTASAAAFSMLAIPVLALAASIAWYREPVAPFEWAGIAAIALALALLAWATRRRDAASAVPTVPEA